MTRFSLTSLLMHELDNLEIGRSSNGAAFFTERGLAKICGVRTEAIAKEADAWAAGKRDSVLARLLLGGGYDAALLYEPIATEHGTVRAYYDDVSMIIVGHYAANVKSEAAIRVCEALVREELRKFSDRLEGVEPTISPSWQQYQDRLLTAAPRHSFVVRRALSEFVIRAIQGGVPVTQETVSDDEIELAWGHYWEHANLAAKYGERQAWARSCPEQAGRSRSTPQEVWAYPNEAEGDFKIWLYDIYVPEQFPKYLNRKVDEKLMTRTAANQLLTAVTRPPVTERGRRRAAGQQTPHESIRLTEGLDDRLSRLLREAWAAALGAGPGARELNRFVRGYRAHARLIGTPLGKRLAPPAVKDAARPRYLHGPWGTFESLLEEAVAASLAVIEDANAVLDAGAADLDHARGALAARLPVGTIDPQGEHLDLSRPVQLAA